MIELAGIYVITGLPHTVFIETVESRANALVNVIEQPEVSFRAVSYEEREGMGYFMDDAWSLEVIRPGEHFAAPVHYLSSMSRSTLEELAMKISRVMPSYQLRLCRWVRIRWIMVNQKRIKDFPEVPYSNVFQAEWL